MNYLKTIVKDNKYIYILYCFFFSLLFKLIDIFVMKDRKKMIFVSYGGKRYNDSPKVISDFIIRNNLDFEIYWAFENPDVIRVSDNIHKIKIDSLYYYYLLLKSKTWITNVSVTRGLNIFTDRHIYINTWHGIPLKKIGKDFEQRHKNLNFYREKCSYMTVNSRYDLQICQHAFDIKFECYHIVGYPRNEILYDSDRFDCLELKRKLNLPLNKKVILYAPTFRENRSDKEESDYHLDYCLWEKKLGDNYVLLLRKHQSLMVNASLTSSNFLFDVSAYPDIADLYHITDILISDYSSVFFDYSILERPMFCFAYDIKEYERGFYLNLEKFFEEYYCTNESELVNKIIKLNVLHGKEFSKKVKDEYLINKNSTSAIINYIMNEVK